MHHNLDFDIPYSINFDIKKIDEKKLPKKENFFSKDQIINNSLSSMLDNLLEGLNSKFQKDERNDEIYIKNTSPKKTRSHKSISISNNRLIFKNNKYTDYKTGEHISLTLFLIKKMMVVNILANIVNIVTISKTQYITVQFKYIKESDRKELIKSALLVQAKVLRNQVMPVIRQEEKSAKL